MNENEKLSLMPVAEMSIIIFTLSRGMDEGQARQRLKNVPIM